jgi:hypothetical protein
MSTIDIAEKKSSEKAFRTYPKLTEKKKKQKILNCKVMMVAKGIYY